jgi:hypothetical protein
MDDQAASTGVDGVFDELFDDRRRSLDHLAGSNLIRKIAGQSCDSAHGQIRPNACGGIWRA